MNHTPLPWDDPDAKPWDDPDAKPLDDLLAVLDWGIEQTDNPLLRGRLEEFGKRWREAGDRR